MIVLCLFANISLCEQDHDIQKVYSQIRPYKGVHNPGVDCTTLKGKVMCGYQGWFAAEGDGSGRGWVHFGRGKEFKPGNCTIDLWPDVSEMGSDEKYPSPFHFKDGSRAYLFSSYNQKTVQRHFQWMKESNIDGVFLQRFASELRKPDTILHRNVVMANVQSGANLYGRTWAMMYDLSGLQAGEIESILINDWKRLVDTMKIKEDKSYLHHNGKPLVAVWGVGFNDGRKYSMDECEKLLRFLKEDKAYGGNAVMLGVPSYWRSLGRDAVNDEQLHNIIRQADIVSPWTVGRYASPQQAQDHAKNVIKPDIEWAKKNNIEFLPVIFPGFSWQNLMKTKGKNVKLDQIPRLKGHFLWSQATAFKEAGAGMIYVAMFDEVDEGTAIFKCTNTPPVGKSSFLTYEGLPSDHYLWLTGRIGELLRSTSKAAVEFPVRKAQQSSPSN